MKSLNVFIDFNSIIILFWKLFLFFFSNFQVFLIKLWAILNWIKDKILGELYKSPRSVLEFTQDINNTA